MSVAASWLALAIILLRLVLKRAPRSIICMMWALVGVRLVLPIKIESIFSLVPSVDTLPHGIMYSKAPTVHTGITYLNSTVNPIISEQLAPRTGDSANPMQIIIFVASLVWLLGVGVMLIYTSVSYIRIRIKVREAVKSDAVWLCDGIESPFILGIFRPRIYVPSNVAATDFEYILAHEKAHLKRFDHFGKPLGFSLLAVNWFNPVMWISYILLCRDIEIACDERVLKEKGDGIKKAYSNALISASVSKRIISACPIAFGEVSVKSRVKKVLDYKKPTLWIIIVASILAIVTAVCFLTNPKENNTPSKTNANTPVTELVTKHNGYTVYSYKDSVDPFKPAFTLYDYPHTFIFSWSAFSSYFAVGRYEIENETLTLKTDDGMYTFVFAITDKGYIFDQSKSTQIPKYLYSADAKEALSPVPHGAMFTFKERYDDAEIAGFVFDSADFDIDNDGKAEHVVMSNGPTSGLFTITFTVYYENGDKLESIVYGGNWSDFYFEENGGKVKLCTVEYESGVKEYYDIVIKDGYIEIKGLLPLGSFPSEE